MSVTESDTDIETGLELFTEVDLDKQIPCGIAQCSDSAKWLNIHKCCNFRVMYCEKHHKFKVEYVEEIMRNPYKGLVCQACNKAIQPRMLKWVQL